MSSLTIVCVIIIYSFKYLDTCYLPKMNVKLKKIAVYEKKCASNSSCCKC